MRRKIMTLLCVPVTFCLLGSCSSDNASKCDPPCALTQTCDEATGTCVTSNSCAADVANSCKYKDLFCEGSSCKECPSGKYNCNGKNTDECESSSTCDGQCDPQAENSCRSTNEYCEGTACKSCPTGKYNCNGKNNDDCESILRCDLPLAECDTAVKNSCKSEEKYCKADKCEDCPTDKYNCNGDNSDSCEKSSACAECDPATANSCGKVTLFCNNASACETCLGDKYNCNGDNKDNCESTTVCTTSTGCIQECIEENPKNCVKNADDLCHECNDTTDCTKNPTSKGTTCNKDGLGGVGRNFCICSANTDCANNPNGKICQKEGAVPDLFKQCTCNTDSDCPTSNPVCHGKTFKWCAAKCTASEDCEKYGLYLCEDNVGKCMPMEM